MLTRKPPKAGALRKPPARLVSSSSKARAEPARRRSLVYAKMSAELQLPHAQPGGDLADARQRAVARAGRGGGGGGTTLGQGLGLVKSKKKTPAGVSVSALRAVAGLEMYEKPSDFY